MAEATEQLPTYELGETISIELEAEDESGVNEVEVSFRHEQESGKKILFSGNGDGQTRALVTLEKTVTEDMALGQYQCFYISLADSIGNKRTVGADNMRFRIEGVPGDHEGPRLNSWRLT